MIPMALAAAMALLAAGPAVAGAAPASGEVLIAEAPPGLKLVFTLRVEVGDPQEQGRIDGRAMRFIPIVGGTVTGARLNGVVLNGGGDWQAIHPDGLTQINARYAIRTADGTVIDVVNPGVRVASPDVAARLARGEKVDAALYYFRTAPRFAVADGPHAWLRRAVFVGRGIRLPHHVEIQVFAVE